MKYTMSFILTTLTTTVVLACPNVNGSFNKCTTGDRIVDQLAGINRAVLEIEQNGNDVIGSFMGAQMDFIVGQTTNNTFRDDQERATITSTITASCDGQTMLVEEDSLITYDWGEVTTSQTETEITMIDSNKKIKMDLKTVENGQTNNLSVTCTRI